MLEDMSYTIRAAVDADVPAIADIYNEAVIRGGASADLEPVSLESRRAWVDSHQPRAKYPVVVIKGPEGAVVGFGSLSKFHQRAGYDGIAELSYYIAGDHQRQGLGTMMVRWLIDAAAARIHACHGDHLRRQRRLRRAHAAVRIHPVRPASRRGGRA